MSANKSKSEAEENLWRWISPLKNPDLTTEKMLQIYTDWTKNAEYDDVSSWYIPVIDIPSLSLAGPPWLNLSVFQL